MTDTSIPSDDAVTAAPTQSREIPDDAAIHVAPGGGAGWRFSKGRIVTGREDDGTLQTRERIVGRVTRFGVHRGETNDSFKKPYEQLECDVETSKGPIYLKASLLDEAFEFKVTRGALDFAWNLAQVRNADTIYLISATQGEAWTNEKGQKMSPSTYVNFAIVGDDNVARQVYKPKTDRNAPRVPMNQQFSALRFDLEAHPLWAPRPANERREDEGEGGGTGASGSARTNLQVLCEESAAKGWPTPEQAPTEWLAMVAAAVGEPPRPTLASYSDENWGWVREQVGPQGDLPGMLLPARQRIDAASRPAARPAPSPSAPASQAAPKPSPAPQPSPQAAAPAPASPFGASYPSGHPGNAPRPGDPGYVDPFENE